MRYWSSIIWLNCKVKHFKLRLNFTPTLLLNVGPGFSCKLPVWCSFSARVWQWSEMRCVVECHQANISLPIFRFYPLIYGRFWVFMLSMWASIHPCRHAERGFVFQGLCSQTCVSLPSAVVQWVREIICKNYFYSQHKWVFNHPEWFNNAPLSDAAPFSPLFCCLSQH